MTINKNRLSFKAISVTQNNQKFYLTSLSSAVLKSMCFITRRGEGEEGFQRVLNEGRAVSIKKYLDDEKGVIPTPLIMSAQKKIEFNFNPKNHEISFEDLEDGFLIIDGQHRLFGLIKSDIEYEIPVVIFNDLNTHKEVNLFIDINTTQKGVPAALLIDLKEMAGKENTLESKQRELFDIMNSTAPMAGLLSASKSERGKISKKAFNDSTTQIFESVFFATQDTSMIAKTLSNYLLAVEMAFSISNNLEARLNKTATFNAILNVFVRVVQRCITEKNNLKVESFYEIVEPISTISYESFKGSNRQTISDLTQVLVEQIEKKVSITEDMF